ncbi:NAD(P)-binding domain-containing protein [Corynebacterium sp. NML130628]|uniref:NAD(P)-binding domain-containing protein n=1 Tax=Corynebacterium sp. NML130628 TaxID=1906333 RepID=UPI00091E81A2|nr:NAD(P)-binding domain-containing protein [Corynebacterium sp. NML130628]OIR44015.1 hypothetical protein BJP07_05950 [Corynebacterium sp. NML130628]
MKTAFLGLGRMGTELALKLVSDHDLVVWNRTAAKTAPLFERGATAADTPSEAVEGAEMVITSLFGPDTVREIVIEPGLIPDGVTWADATEKDARLMLATAEAADKELPAVAAAVASLQEQQKKGHGDEDFSSVVVYR